MATTYISPLTFRRDYSFELEFSKLGCIGSGTSGNVFLAVHADCQLTVAVKELKRDDVIIWDKMEPGVPMEISALANCQNVPGVIKFMQYHETQDMFYIVLEKLPLVSDLFHYMEEIGHIKEIQAKNIMKKIVTAIQGIHKCNYVHRDLKLENILLDHNSGDIKIVDFGNAVPYDTPITNEYLTEGGTAHYDPPETLTGEERFYDPLHGTVWAVGIILYYMVCGRFPTEMPYGYSCEKIALIWTKDLSDEVKGLIRDCLHPDRHLRPTLEAILEHPWMLVE